MPERCDFPRGSLAVISVPIGNPLDLSPRAAQVLAEADLVAAEDTRTARRLLSSLGLSKQLTSYHDWNEADRASSLLARVADGERIALVTEAGTPGLSDPGYDIVRAARQKGLTVFPIPGPSAITAFLSVCGLPTNAFSFHGFPPNRRNARRAFFAQLAARPETLVFFESPRRVVAALGDAIEVFGDRECSLAREMTKPHEEFLFGSLSQIAEDLGNRPRVLGEVCWGVRGFAAPQDEPTDRDLAEAALQTLRQDLPLKAAARDLAQRCAISTKQAYAALMAAKARTSQNLREDTR